MKKEKGDIKLIPIPKKGTVNKEARYVMLAVRNELHEIFTIFSACLYETFSKMSCIKYSQYLR